MQLMRKRTHTTRSQAAHASHFAARRNKVVERWKRAFEKMRLRKKAKTRRAPTRTAFPFPSSSLVFVRSGKEREIYLLRRSHHIVPVHWRDKEFCGAIVHSQSLPTWRVVTISVGAVKLEEALLLVAARIEHLLSHSFTRRGIDFEISALIT